MKSFLEQAKEKAEALFLEEQTNFPDLYTDSYKPLFIATYVEGYLQGYSDSSDVAMVSLDNLSNELLGINSNNEEIQ
jgi:hypothetical protein